MRPNFESHDAEIRRVLPAVIEHAGHTEPSATHHEPSIGRLVDAAIGSLLDLDGNAFLGGYRLYLESGRLSVRNDALVDRDNRVFESDPKAEHFFAFDFPPQYRVFALISALREGRARAKFCTMAVIRRAIDSGQIERDDWAVERLQRLFDAAMITVGIAQLDVSLEHLKTSIRSAAAARNE